MHGKNLFFLGNHDDSEHHALLQSQISFGNSPYFLRVDAVLADGFFLRHTRKFVFKSVGNFIQQGRFKFGLLADGLERRRIFAKSFRNFAGKLPTNYFFGLQNDRDYFHDNFGGKTCRTLEIGQVFNDFLRNNLVTFIFAGLLTWTKRRARLFFRTRIFFGVFHYNVIGENFFVALRNKKNSAENA